MNSCAKAMKRLSERMSTLDDLFSRGIIQGPLLRKQLRSLLSSSDAGIVFAEKIEPERKAIKILSRLEDPAGWRLLSMKGREERETVFYKTLEEIMSSSEDRSDRILKMLLLACLPFYSGFIPLDAGKKAVESGTKPSRVSVLD
jgi:hypothetical protein